MLRRARWLGLIFLSSSLEMYAGSLLLVDDGAGAGALAAAVVSSTCCSLVLVAAVCGAAVLAFLCRWTLLSGSGVLRSPSNTSRSSSIAFRSSSGACLGCWRIASSRSRAASKMRSAGVREGIAIGWCQNLTVSEICSPPVDGTMPRKAR